jgi:alkyl hydroperoxide reductase subunit D
MKLEDLLSHDSARDLRLNLRYLREPVALTRAQAWGAALTSAMAARNPAVLAAVAEEGLAHLTPEQANGARIAAALMGMNNIYFRFTHMVEAPEYAQMPAGLRMQAMRDPGVPRRDFELWCLAASAVTGCGACVASHEKTLRKEGATPEMVQEAARIAAIVHAAALAAEVADVLGAAPAAPPSV